MTWQRRQVREGGRPPKRKNLILISTRGKANGLFLLVENTPSLTTCPPFDCAHKPGAPGAIRVARAAHPQQTRLACVYRGTDYRIRYARAAARYATRRGARKYDLQFDSAGGMGVLYRCSRVWDPQAECSADQGARVAHPFAASCVLLMPVSASATSM